MKKSLLISSVTAIALLVLAPAALATTVNTSVSASAEGTVTSGTPSDGGSGMAPWTGALSANVRSGVAPLVVTFYASGLQASAYVIDYGDGANSGSLSATNMPTTCPQGAKCPDTAQLNVTHTYSTNGTYTATLEPYVSCMWQGPVRCMLQPAPLGQVQITVGKGGGTDNSNGGTVTGGSDAGVAEGSDATDDSGAGAPPANEPPGFFGGFVGNVVHWFVGPDAPHTTSSNGVGGTVTSTTSAAVSDDGVNIETNENVTFFAKIWNGFWGMF